MPYRRGRQRKRLLTSARFPGNTVRAMAELLAAKVSERAHNMINKRLERQEIERLLPWHAAGTLSRREADLVERALAGDTELAQRYGLVRQELAETVHLNETLGAPSERAMEKLFAAIEAEANPSAPVSRRIFVECAQWLPIHEM